MTLQELKRWRIEAKRWSKSEYGRQEWAERIVVLCEEVQRLSALVDENEARYGDYTRMPFGKHKGEQLGLVPDDYLAWWLRKNGDRGILELEARHGVGARKFIGQRSLKLYDYLVERFNRATG